MNSNGFNYFENSGYVNNRNRKRTLILDIDDSAATDNHLGEAGEFNIQLYEPMIIDKHSEVYLDNFLSFNSNISQTGPSGAFLLKINEFNMNSNVASTHNATGGNPGGQHIFNSLIIPNEHRSVENNHSSIVHKGKKFNYVCDINPQTISSLSGKVTDLEGLPMFHGPNRDHLFTYSITGIDNYSTSTLFPVEQNTTFNLTGTGVLTVPGSTTGVFLATHLGSTTTLHFATNNELTSFDRTQDGTITFTNGGTSIVIDHSPASKNLDLHLINNPGRFIAEFSIISRE